MIVTVDVNILFSAVITPDSRIGEIVTHPTAPFQRVSCYYAFVELFKHQPKIIKLAKRTEGETLDILYTLLRHLEFCSETLIEQRHWLEAERLTSGVDSFDVAYLALTLQTDGWLWTGDKKLTTHLKSIGFNRIVTTGELYEMLRTG